MADEKFERFKARLARSVAEAVEQGVCVVPLSDKTKHKADFKSCRCPLGCLILQSEMQFPSAGMLATRAWPPLEITQQETSAFIVGFENGDLQNATDLAYCIEVKAVEYMRLGQEYYRQYVVGAH